MDATEKPGKKLAPARRSRRFWRWSRRNKGFVFALILASMALSILGLRPRPNTVEAALQGYFDSRQAQTAEWQYEVGGAFVEGGELAANFPLMAQMRLGKAGAAPIVADREALQRWSREQYHTDLLAYAALREGMLHNPAGRLWMEQALRRAAAELYLRQQMETPDLNLRIDATPAESLAYIRARSGDPALRGEAAAVQAAVGAMLSATRRDSVNAAAARARDSTLILLRDRYGPRWRDE